MLAFRAGRSGSRGGERLSGRVDYVEQFQFHGRAAGRWVLYWLKFRRLGPRRVALASYPRSGNTWVRYLLEQATGESCGSVYKQDRIMPRGPEGIVVKTHQFDSFRYTHAVHLVRNPLRAIESYYRWMGDAKGDARPDWDGFVIAQLSYWRLHARHWRHAPGHRILVRYEDLRENPVSELHRLCEWLGYTVDEGMCARIVADATLEKMRSLDSRPQGSFFAEGSVDASAGAFSPSQHQAAISALRRELKLFGYDEMLASSATA